MKANELRIGNLVECDALRDAYKDRIPYFGKHIYAVHSACVDFVKLELGDEAIQKVEIFAVKPIKLNDLWLLKSGFKLYNDGGELTGNDMFWIHPKMAGSISHRTYIYVRNNLKIQYVHQLQNLYFALTVEELEIKL